MPTYNYECKKCEHLWEDYQSISNREKPLQEPCPKCGQSGCVSKSWKDCTPAVEVDMTLTPNKATGGRWNELMKRMKQGTPKRFHNRMDASNNTRARRWY